MHHTNLIQNTADTWAAVCEDCPDWMGGDGTKGEARQDARMHQRGESHPWNPAGFEPWAPERQPK